MSTKKPATTTSSIAMTLSKQTTNTVVYRADEEGAAIETVYVQKTAFNGKDVPEKINVTFAPV